MTRRRSGSIRRALVGAVLAVLAATGAATAGTLTGAAPARAASIYCDSASESRQPVLLVHGFSSSPDTWGPDTRRVLARGGRTACVALFNYAAFNDKWATNINLGPTLASTIDNLAAASAAGHGSGKVIVVAHSNGGLLARCAADPGCNGGRTGTAGHLLEVITFGTPNTGSFIAGVNRGGVGDAVSAMCGSVLGLLPPWCPEVHLLTTSQAARGFIPGSAQLRDLPQLPATIPVYAMGAKVEVYSTFFAWSRIDVGDAGDLVVLEDSATAAANKVGPLGGAQIIDCGQIDIGNVWRNTFSCTHVTETNDTRFLDAALWQITLAERQHTTATTTTTASLKNIRLPQGVCRPDSTSVQLQNGTGRGHSQLLASQWSGDGTFEVTLTGQQDAGDLNGDGTPDLAVAISCGGYGGSNISHPHIIVLSGPSTGPFRLLADVVPANPGLLIVGVHEVSLDPGELTSRNLAQLDGDPSCCSTAHQAGTDHWKWDGHQLVSIGERSSSPAHDDLPGPGETRCASDLGEKGQVLYVKGVSCARGSRAALSATSPGAPPDPGLACSGFQNGQILCTPDGDYTEPAFMAGPHVRTVSPFGSGTPTS